MFFKKEKKEIIIGIRKCNCGCDGYDKGNFTDIVHCNNCGALYTIYPGIVNPVAKITYKVN